jgi:hypothetical protein
MLNGDTQVRVPPSDTGGWYALDLLQDQYGGRWVAVGGYDDVIARIAGEPGSRGVVFISPREGDPHIFNVAHTDDGVVFLDGQIGGLAALPGNAARDRADDVPPGRRLGHAGGPGLHRRTRRVRVHTPVTERSSPTPWSWCRGRRAATACPTRTVRWPALRSPRSILGGRLPDRDIRVHTGQNLSSVRYKTYVQ